MEDRGGDTPRVIRTIAYSDIVCVIDYPYTYDITAFLPFTCYLEFAFEE
jgi:hypothetical protein